MSEIIKAEREYLRKTLEEAWENYKSNDLLNPANLPKQKVIKLSEKKKK